MKTTARNARFEHHGYAGDGRVKQPLSDWHPILAGEGYGYVVGCRKMSIARKNAGELAGEITETVANRGDKYGPPEENFANIAAFWRAWLKARHRVDVEIDGADVGHMCALIKTARLAETPLHRDSALDGAIYTMLGHGCALDAHHKRAALESCEL